MLPKPGFRWKAPVLTIGKTAPQNDYDFLLWITKDGRNNFVDPGIRNSF